MKTMCNMICLLLFRSREGLEIQILRFSDGCQLGGKTARLCGHFTF